MKAVMYHYVREPEPSLPNFGHLHIEDFKQQLDYFAEEYILPSLEEFKESLITGKPISNSVFLTFDDGFKDHYQYVFPELKKRGLWGFFYIPTMPYIKNKLVDVHRIHLLIGKFGGKKIHESIQELITEDMLSHSHVKEFSELTYNVHVNQNNDEYTMLAKRTLNYFISYQHREQVLDKLMEIYFPDEAASATEFYMSPAEIKEMADAGMVMGAHTVNHPVLSKLEATEQKVEIEESSDYIENIVGNFNLKTFCYPYGGFHSFTPETEKILANAGFICTFNVEARDIESKDLKNRLQALPRYDCNRFPFGSYR